MPDATFDTIVHWLFPEAFGLPRKTIVPLLCLILNAASVVSDIPDIKSPAQRIASKNLEYLIWQFDTGGRKIFRFPTKRTPYRFIIEQEDASVSEVNRIAEDHFWEGALSSYKNILATRGRGFKSAEGYILALAYGAQRENAWAAKAVQGSSISGSTVCPYLGNLANDGCLTSPGGSEQNPTFYSGYTGASYATRPNENVPSVDYPDGVPKISNSGRGICGLDHIQDPATAPTGSPGVGAPGCGIFPRGCSYLLSGRLGYTTGPTIDCGGVSTDNLTLAGFELNPVGGHASTKIVIEVNATSPHIILKYLDGSQADSNVYLQGGWVYVVGSSSHIQEYADSFDERWPTNFSTVGSGTATAFGTTVTITATASGRFLPGQHFATGITGNIVSQLTGTSGDRCPAADCNGGTGTYLDNRGQTVGTPRSVTSVYTGDGQAMNTTGGVSLQYVYFGHINGRPITGVIGQSNSAGSTNGDIICQWCDVEGFIYYYAGEHGEFFEGVLRNPNYNMTIVNMKYLNSIFYQPSNVAIGSSTALIYISTGGAGGQASGQSLTITNPYVNDNTLVTRANDGRQTTSALVAWGDYYFANAEIENNFTDTNGSLYNNLCNGAPKIGGSVVAGPAFAKPITIGGNTDLNTGNNIDRSIMAFRSCSQA